MSALQPVSVIRCEQPAGKEYYQVSFSNGETDAYSPEEVYSYALYEEGRICEPDYEHFREGILVKRALAKLASYVSLSLRSSGQVKDKLLHMGYSESVCEIVTRKLMEKGFLDDPRFCEKYVAGARRTRVVSYRMLYMELLQKGVPAEIVESYFATQPLDDDSLIRQAMEKKCKSKPGITREQLQRYLAGKGFSPEEIYQATREWNGGQDE